MTIILQDPAHAPRRDSVSAGIVQEGMALALRDGASAGAIFMEDRRIDSFVIARVLSGISPDRMRGPTAERRRDYVTAARIDDGISLLKHHSWRKVMIHLLEAGISGGIIDRALSGIQPRRKPV